MYQKLKDLKEVSNQANCPRAKCLIKSVLTALIMLSGKITSPLSQVTRISYELPRAANVHITIYNMLGQKMEMLVDDYMMSGVFEVIFNATGLKAGIYEYVMEAEGFRATKRMILLK